jgi:hypothetical protein
MGGARRVSTGGEDAILSICFGVGMRQLAGWFFMEAN